MSVNRQVRLVVAWGVWTLVAALVPFGCAAPPPGPAASSASRHGGYTDGGSPASGEETAYTRELKQRMGAPPPNAGGRSNQGGANTSRSQLTALPSVPDFVNELYASEVAVP